MNELIASVRPYLEILNFIAGIVVATAALLALRQIRLMKLDMLARSERAAKEKAIEAAFAYAKAVDAYGSARTVMIENKLSPSYKGPVSPAFSFELIPEDYREMAKLRYNSKYMIGPLNTMDGIAASLITGVGDEQTAFSIFGEALCGNVAGQYDIVCISRHLHASQSFASLVELYQMWSARLSKKELEKARQNINEQLKSIPDKRVSPLSPNLPK